MKYEVHSLDVWGNARDGWEVNQAFHTGICIEIREGDSDEDILQKLADADILSDNWKRYKLEIEGDDYFMTIFHASQQANMLPLWNLVKTQH